MPHDHDRSLHNLCRKYMHYHVVLKLKDGRSVHGILEKPASGRQPFTCLKESQKKSNFTAGTDCR